MTSPKTFTDWYNREDYGDRDQLERCWASGQNAQALLDMNARADLARKVIEAVKAEHLSAPPDNPEDEAYTRAIEDALTALRELFQVEGVEVE